MDDTGDFMHIQSYHKGARGVFFSYPWPNPSTSLRSLIYLCDAVRDVLHRCTLNHLDGGALCPAVVQSHKRAHHRRPSA